jgi:hypothetical protein
MNVPRLLKAAALGWVAMLVVNVLIALAARPLLDIPPEFEPIGPIAPVIASTMWGVLGTITLLLVAKFAKKNPVRVYWVVSVIGLLLSYVPNINLARDSSEFPGTTTAAMVVLAAQHLIGFLIFVPIVTRALRPSASTAA